MGSTVMSSIIPNAPRRGFNGVYGFRYHDLEGKVRRVRVVCDRAEALPDCLAAIRQDNEEHGTDSKPFSGVRLAVFDLALDERAARYLEEFQRLGGVVVVYHDEHRPDPVAVQNLYVPWRAANVPYVHLPRGPFYLHWAESLIENGDPMDHTGCTTEGVPHRLFAHMDEEQAPTHVLLGNCNADAVMALVVACGWSLTADEYGYNSLPVFVRYADSGRGPGFYDLGDGHRLYSPEELLEALSFRDGELSYPVRLRDGRVSHVPFYTALDTIFIGLRKSRDLLQVAAYFCLEYFGEIDHHSGLMQSLDEAYYEGQRACTHSGHLLLNRSRSHIVSVEDGGSRRKPKQYRVRVVRVPFDNGCSEPYYLTWFSALWHCVHDAWQQFNQDDVLVVLYTLNGPGGVPQPMMTAFMKTVPQQDGTRQLKEGLDFDLRHFVHMLHGFMSVRVSAPMEEDEALAVVERGLRRQPPTYRSPVEWVEILEAALRGGLLPFQAAFGTNAEAEEGNRSPFPVLILDPEEVQRAIPDRSGFCPSAFLHVAQRILLEQPGQLWRSEEFDLVRGLACGNIVVLRDMDDGRVRRHLHKEDLVLRVASLRGGHTLVVLNEGCNTHLGAHIVANAMVDASA